VGWLPSGLGYFICGGTHFTVNFNVHAIVYFNSPHHLGIVDPKKNGIRQGLVKESTSVWNGVRVLNLQHDVESSGTRGADAAELVCSESLRQGEVLFLHYPRGEKKCI
jgi:hypothetical protein